MQKFNINTLVLHRIVKNKISNFEDILEDVFDEILKRYRQNKTFLTVDDAFSKGIKNDSICLTFDDGFKSDVEIVLPKLLENKATATFFVVKNYLNTNRSTNLKT